MATHSEKNINELQKIFTQENLTIPFGFTDNDVTATADKLISDSFMMYFCHDITLLSMTTYSSALSDCTQTNVRNYFQMSLEFSTNIQTEITEIMLAKGIYVKPSQVAIENQIDFVENKRYLSEFFSGHRPLNVAGIANLARIIHRAQFSKMIFVAFNKIAKSKEIQKHFSKGRDELDQVISSLQEILEKENIPLSASGDLTIYDVQTSPFSEKLMLFFVNTCLGMFCFLIIGQAMNSSLRTDIMVKLTKISTKFRKFYGEGLLLTIEKNWLEKPPQTIDRKV